MINNFVIVVTMALVIWLTHRFKLIAHCRLALLLTGQARGILFDASLSDAEKEIQTQQAAKKLIIQFALILCSGAGALLLPLLPLFALATLHLVNIDQILDNMMSVESLLLFAILGPLILIKLNSD